MYLGKIAGNFSCQFMAQDGASFKERTSGPFPPTGGHIHHRDLTLVLGAVYSLDKGGDFS